jgi:DNA-binding response OmpR family regulator
MRLLLVEDESELASAVARGLRREGHAVDIAATVTEAELKLASAEYDLLLLDWNLPDGAGVDICRRVAHGEMPLFGDERPRVLMLTARDDVDDRVLGLDAGADDYVVKPFAFAELAARVRALLRRDDVGSPLLKVGDLELDPRRFEASQNGSVLELTAKEFSLLHYFMAHPGVVMSQETLLEHVWDEMADPFTNVVRVTISNMRRKLVDPAVIETVPGRGYRLVAR